MNSDLTSSASATARRLAEGCVELERQLQALGADGAGADAQAVASGVHGVRKLGKSLRGGFVLFGLGKSAGREIQAVGRLLAAPRDAVSRRSTWGRLGWNDGSPSAAAILTLLDEHTASAARRPPPEVIAWCLERVSAASGILGSLDPASLDGRLSAGLAKLEKAVIKRCRKLPRRGEEDFHDARKALKAHLGALTFLHGKSALEPLRVELAELLGDENDLATLRHWLLVHGFTSALVPDLWDKLEKRQEKLRVKAIRDAKKIAK
jgi:hypothetical protein